MYSKRAIIVVKIYIDNQKYNRVNKSFDFKLIFLKTSTNELTYNLMAI